jgi:hypothetical protein
LTRSPDETLVLIGAVSLEHRALASVPPESMEEPAGLERSVCFEAASAAAGLSIVLLWV